MNSKIREICLLGLLIAVVCVSTMFIRIAIPATEGYIHFGDGFIVIIAVMFGKKYGAVAGGVGSALADVFSGYLHWALFTFIIKAVMGYVVGCIKDYKNENSKFFSAKNVFATVLGEVVMIFGYFIFGILLKGVFMVPDVSELGGISPIEYGFVQALSSVFENLIQAVGGIVVFDVLGFALHNAKISRFINTNLQN